MKVTIKNMRDLFRLDEKVVMVTGALGLIGKEVSFAMAESGAALVLVDKNSDGEFSKGIRNNFGSDVLSLEADIKDEKSVQHVVEQSINYFGRIDVLIHCAALDAKFDSNITEKVHSDYHNFPLDDLKMSLDVNVIGTHLICQAVIKQMLLQKKGNIILVASTYSIVAPNNSLYDSPGKPTMEKPIDYVLSKSIVPNFARDLAVRYAKKGIRVNCVTPHAIYNDHEDWFQENFSRLSPVGRMCRLDEIRGPFVFMASDASSYMNGSTLTIDGGWTAW